MLFVKTNRLKDTLSSLVCQKITVNSSSRKSSGMKVFIIEKKQRLFIIICSVKWSWFQNIGWQLETIFHKESFTTFPQVFVTFLTVHEAPSDRIFDQSSSSSRNPENNLDFQNYDPENCFVTNKSLFLHQDSSTRTSHVVFQDSYKLTSKEEFDKKRSFAWCCSKIANMVRIMTFSSQNKFLFHLMFQLFFLDTYSNTSLCESRIQMISYFIIVKLFSVTSKVKNSHFYYYRNKFNLGLNLLSSFQSISLFVDVWHVGSSSYWQCKHNI